MDLTSTQVPPWVQNAEQLAGLGTWTFDLRTGALTSNATVRGLLDLPDGASDPTLRDYFDAVHPDDQATLHEQWKALVREGYEYVVEHRLLFPGGRIKYMRAVACVGVDDTGRIVVAHGITQDITDRRLATLEVERERDRNRTILASLHEGFMITNDGVIVEVNPALCELTGYDGSDLVGPNHMFPLWPDDDLASLQRLREFASVHGVAQGEVVLRRKDGSRFPAHLSSRPMRGHGDQELWITTVRDVTAEREHERMLRRRAETDPLTGVLNSRAFREMMVLACTQGIEPLSLALIDIDNYKQINDRHGHAVGDSVLCEVVDLLVTATSSAGRFGRVGGDEFAVLLPGCDVVQARALLAAALDKLRGRTLPMVGTVTASVGVAQATPGGDGALFRAADTRLYHAKAMGRDQVQ